jgi:hypothetical protein
MLDLEILTSVEEVQMVAVTDVPKCWKTRKTTVLGQPEK